MTFWSWYRHSARTDGALVSAPRRVLGFSIQIALVVWVWYWWMSRTQPKLARVPLRLARLHPLCFFGMVLAFVLMSLRGTALEYLAYSVYRAQGIHFKWVLLGGESKVRRRYEETFGKDKFLRAPELLGGLSLLVFLVSGFALVFTSR